MARRKLTTAEPAPAPADAPERRRKDTGWFAELGDVLFELAGTLNRTFIITGIIALGAMVMALWGVNTGHYGIALGALVVFWLAMLVLCVAGAYMLWLNAKTIVKWVIARRRGVGQELPAGQSAIGTADTE